MQVIAFYLYTDPVLENQEEPSHPLLSGVVKQ